MKYYFYSGSYADRTEDGIVRFCMDTERERIEKVSVHKGILNPSYLAFDSRKEIMYAVQEEVPVGAVHALKVEEDGTLTELDKCSTEGADPCHVLADSTETFLFTANYTSGSLAVFELDENKVPKSLLQLIEHEGRSVHPTRQQSAHVHYAKEHEGKLYLADLGMDRVIVYEIDHDEKRLLNTGTYLELPAGSGPRHLEFHNERPDILYVICELSNQIAVFQKENGMYERKQLICTLPENFEGESTTAAIKMQGNLLFASNRGHDSIAVYQIQGGGLLTLSDIAFTGGKTPRDFLVIGDYIVTANQDSDLITVLKIDWEHGKLNETGMKAETVRPCCILGSWIERE